MCSVEGHRFWPDAISLRDALTPGSSLTHSQVTDVFMLALAVSRGGKLATLDRRISTSVVPGGPAALEVIPA